MVRRRFGYRRLHALLHRDGTAVNHKRVYRLYVEEKLWVRKRGRKRRVAVARAPMLVPEKVNQVWSVDFVSDALASGRRFRTLNIADDFSREAPAIEVDTSLGGVRVARVLDRLKIERGLPLLPGSARPQAGRIARLQAAGAVAGTGPLAGELRRTMGANNRQARPPEWDPVHDRRDPHGPRVWLRKTGGGSGAGVGAGLYGRGCHPSSPHERRPPARGRGNGRDRRAGGLRTSSANDGRV